MCEISVIIPVYNGEPFIKGVFEALEKQSFQRFEAIFIDDGSTDKSAEMLSSHVGKTSFPFRVLTQRNLGVSSARNRGCREANGRYLCFIDVDDTPSEDYLAYLHQAVTAQQCRFAVGKTVRTRQNLPLKNLPAYICRLPREEALTEYLYQRLGCGIWTTISERALWEEHGLAFKEGYKYGEDMYVLWKLFAFNETVAVIESPAIYCYNNQIHSATNRNFSPERKQALTQLQELEDFFDLAVPNFAPLFKKYAVARSCWNILGRAALGTKNFKAFTAFFTQIGAKETLGRLSDFQEWKIRLSSRLFCRMPRLYFILLKLYVRLFASHFLPGRPEEADK